MEIESLKLWLDISGDPNWVDWLWLLTWLLWSFGWVYLAFWLWSRKEKKKEEARDLVKYNNALEFVRNLKKSMIEDVNWVTGVRLWLIHSYSLFIKCIKNGWNNYMLSNCASLEMFEIMKWYISENFPILIENWYRDEILVLLSSISNLKTYSEQLRKRDEKYGKLNEEMNTYKYLNDVKNQMKQDKVISFFKKSIINRLEVTIMDLEKFTHLLEKEINFNK